MGKCERCGVALIRWQRRFCSKRCGGYRAVPQSKRCGGCRQSLAAAAFGLRDNGRLRARCHKCEASSSARRAAAHPDVFRRMKAASERKRRRDPVIGPQLREVRRRYHRFRGSTSEDRAYADVLKRDPCAYCQESAGEIDHIIATVAGGSDHWLNLTAACRSCNAQKNDRPVLLWIFRQIQAAEESRVNP